MRIILLMIIPLLLAFDTWSEKDTYREVVFLSALTADWAQTRDIAAHPEEWSESNIIMGEHPTLEEVNTYFFSMAIGHALIAYALPAKYRPYWQWSWISVEIYCIGHNNSAGVRFNF